MPITLLKAFATGNGNNPYLTYASDHDTNAQDLETFLNDLEGQFNALGGNNAALALDLTQNLGFQTGIVDRESLNATFSGGDTLITFAPGVALTGSNGRVAAPGNGHAPGAAPSQTFIYALQADGLVVANTLPAQGILDLWSVDWDGAAFDTGTLTFLTNVIPAGDDFAAMQTVLNASSIYGVPTQTHTRLAERIENLERLARNDLVNAQSGGPALLPPFRATQDEVINQTTHGFVLNKVLGISAGAFVEADANPVVEPVGIVSEVIDTDNFRICYSGRCDTLSGLTANTLHYLDATGTGDLTTTAPAASGDAVRRILIALSATSAIVNIQYEADVP